MANKPIPLEALPLNDLMLWLNDNQLPDGNTFLLPGSVGSSALASASVTPDKIASQAIGSCQNVPSIANGVSNISNWTGLTSGTYTTAAAGGLTTTRAGLYLIRGTVRWDGGTAGSRFIDIAVAGSAIGGAGFGSGVPASTVEPTTSITAPWPVSAGTVITLHVSNGQGAAVVPVFARVDATLLSPS